MGVKVEKILELLGPLKSQWGEVVLAGLHSAKEGALYAVGLNPGYSYKALRLDQHLQKELSSATSLPAMLNETWANGRNYQKGIGELFSHAFFEKSKDLGIDENNVVVTNAIFTHSKSRKEIASEFKHSSESPSTDGAADIKRIFDLYWPVHAYLLSKIRPQIIVALGHGTGSPTNSAFELLRRKSESESSTIYSKLPPANSLDKIATAKWTEVTYATAEGEVKAKLIGVPHPSFSYNHKRYPKASDVILALLKNQDPLEAISDN